MTNMRKLRKKKPSKELLKAVANIVGSFQKTTIAIEEALSIGRKEGFSDMEIGKMIREEMLAAGYDPRTIRRSLPPTAKQIQKTRKDYTHEDKMSSYEHREEDQNQYTDEPNDSLAHNEVRNACFAPKLPYLSTIAQNQGIAIQEAVASTQLKDNQPLQTVKGDLGSGRILKLPENDDLLKFELSISRDVYWDYLAHLIEDDSQFWISGVLNQCTGKILSLTIGRSGMTQS